MELIVWNSACSGFAAVSGKSDPLWIISYSKVMNTSLLALMTQKALHVCDVVAF